MYKDIWLQLKAKKKISVRLTGTMTRKQMMRAISKEKDEDPEKDPLTKIKCSSKLDSRGAATDVFVLELVQVATSTQAAKKVLKDARKNVEKFVANFEKSEWFEKAKNTAQNTRVNLLSVLNIPTQAEVEKLEKKIHNLEKRLHTISQKAA